MGVGFNLVVSQSDKKWIMEQVSQYYDCYEIGTIISGDKKISFCGRINWI